MLVVGIGADSSFLLAEDEFTALNPGVLEEKIIISKLLS